MTARRVAGWTAATVLATPLFAWLFAPPSVFAFRALVTEGDINGFGTAWWVEYLAPALILGGALVFAVVCFACTARLGAPAQMWYGALAWSAAYLCSILLTATPSLILALRPDPIRSVSEVLLVAAGGTPFVRWGLLLLAAVAYPAASWLGCAIGARRAGSM